MFRGLLGPKGAGVVAGPTKVRLKDAKRDQITWIRWPVLPIIPKAEEQEATTTFTSLVHISILEGDISHDIVEIYIYLNNRCLVFF